MNEEASANLMRAGGWIYCFGFLSDWKISKWTNLRNALVNGVVSWRRNFAADRNMFTINFAAWGHNSYF